MKKHLLIVIIVLIYTELSAQSNGLKFYNTNGTPYKRDCKNISDINKDFDKHGRIKTYFAKCDSVDCGIAIGFKLFTKEPLWALIDNPDKIKKVIDSFWFNQYLQGWEFESDLEKFIKKGVLSDSYIIETLGAPDKRAKLFSNNISFETWKYIDLNIELTLKGGIVVGYIKID